MDATHSPAIDPAALIGRLDADAIRRRLDTLARERKALLVLLRAALRIRQDAARPLKKGVRHD